MADYLTWMLNAIKLPARIIAGLFLFSLLALGFDHLAIINLAEFHPLARSAVILGALGFGSLSLLALCGVVYDALMQGHKRTLLAARREIRREERERNRAEYEAQVVKRLDYLSVPEIRHVADCLRKNEQSFFTYVYSGPVSNMMAKELVSTPGGTHHQDYYPYYFVDLPLPAACSHRLFQ
jgi:hypothetical protein